MCFQFVLYQHFPLTWSSLPHPLMFFSLITGGLPFTVRPSTSLSYQRLGPTAVQHGPLISGYWRSCVFNVVVLLTAWTSGASFLGELCRLKKNWNIVGGHSSIVAVALHNLCLWVLWNQRACESLAFCSASPRIESGFSPLSHVPIDNALFNASVYTSVSLVISLDRTQHILLGLLSIASQKSPIDFPLGGHIIHLSYWNVNNENSWIFTLPSSIILLSLTHSLSLPKFCMKLDLKVTWNLSSITDWCWIRVGGVRWKVTFLQDKHSTCI